MKLKIFPTIIATSQKDFENRFKKVMSLSNEFQLDVMDGRFVKNSSFNFNFKIPKDKKNKKFEAHLMIKNPKEWIKKHHKKVDMIIFHIEPFLKSKDKNKNSKKEILNLINEIKEKKKKVGIAINPETSVKNIEFFLDKIDKVLVLCVNPGKYGAKFIPKTLKKIEHVQKTKKVNSKIDISVDGGINEKNIILAKNAGANHFAIGSYFQNSRSPKRSMKKLKGIIKH